MNKKTIKRFSVIALSLFCLNTVNVKADTDPYNTWWNAEVNAEKESQNVIENYDDFTKAVNAEEGINVEAKSAILMEPTTGKILYEKNIDEKYAPASVTKVMTMLLTMENIDSGKITLQDKVTCSENAKNMGGSTMLLDTGEIRTVEELLKGVAIASGNDAAVALAEFLGGTEDAFAEMMNKRAQELGMTNTTFKNCNGLPAVGHESTARDIAKMSLELLKHPTILKYTGTYMETISEGRKSPIELVNHNKLVRFFEGCDGLKTGFTDEAKYCITATATKNKVRMLSVIMGAPTFKIRNRDASMLMNYGFSKYEGRKLLAKDEDVETIYMSKQTDRFFIAKAKEDLVVVLPKGTTGELEKRVVIEELQKEYKSGDVVGKCEVYLGEDKVGEVQLYSDRDIKKGNILDNFKYNVRNLFKKGI
ncbi:D-alanyl-D-alanine carboxypeptidase family protein [Clostridium gasigenes]|uniref:serine-type D-Ala-D-Ala carboxypeptidase n=1 Tax=Clostridium gasigenes TaxID=94869 RepID=A0A1H0N126_9CLOT|nr:D-alanyl-D-alanine carboxypeptidase family protein [Clostridium gasigenes]MBB6625201.1 D-alanyl-D-alanine carboxypeptidase [Clostridium gasigenes]MBB6716205.1 D-alanyl-D-alanine carboxypeptidase [Clostridium gasigenes]MBU3087393.1 D-alanyl-D-alanine carboxypeptidase [Clostridium gasigenes]MBU3131533.1 D-alanyl-D-alanine carboxypeptidase [Clostridium gasigenes]MBU3135084.1 D-alanyl-D-alanine carboxypeptidase [Clostridium gasigenes]